MNLTLDKLVDILQDVGIAHRDGHPSSTGKSDVPNGITLSLDFDIDISERLRVAVDRINAATAITEDRLVAALIDESIIREDETQGALYTTSDRNVITDEIENLVVALNTTK